MEDNKQIMTPNDLVAYYGNEGGYQSAGYLISSIFDSKNLPPIVTINNEPVKGAASMQTQVGGKSKKNKNNKDDSFTSSLRGFAIPLGLGTLLASANIAEESEPSIDIEPSEMQMDGGKKGYKVDIIDDSLYNRLLSLVEEHKKEKKSRKTKRNNDVNKKSLKKGKKTRKHH